MKSILDFRTRVRYRFYNIGYRLHSSFDGYPLPPPRLIELIIGTREVAWYQLGGLFMHQAIGTFMRRNGAPLETFKSILDFGCGCGRLVRWLSAIRDKCEIWGCDYNSDLVDWCQRKLSDIARFKTNGADPPLDFEDGKFEFVYSYSVLTHLARDRQRPWFEELARVTRPGGYLMVTVHGLRCAWRAGFSEQMLQDLESGGLVIFGEEHSGSNMCAVYHGESYMREKVPPTLELIDFLPGGVRDGSEQDMYLYRKAA